MSDPADLILADADVWTGDAARTWSDSVAIRGDRIVAVGDDAVRGMRGPATEIASLPGRMVVPGFQDAHVHPLFGARNLLELNLDRVFGKEAYLDEIAGYAAAHPDLEWITGGGWSIAAFPGGRPLKEDLDAVVPDRPVFLLNNDVHGAWVNSRALERGGITASTADPWDGRIERDERGEPMGTLTEGAAYTFRYQVVPATSPERWRACLELAQRELHALGITGWQDAWVEAEHLRAYRSAADEGALTMRVVASLWWDRHRGLEQIDDLVEQREWGSGGGVDAGTVKIMLDGCPESYTAAMLDPFNGPEGEDLGTGIAFVEAGVLTEAVTRLDGLGFQVHFHALGDRAARIALDAVEAARSANGVRDARHHIAHLQLPDPVDLARLPRLGVVANLQTFWAQYDGATATMLEPLVGEARFARLYPFGSIRRTGAVMACGSDWPVSTPNPLAELEVGVTRTPLEARDEAPMMPDERLDLAAALSAFTRGSAYVNRDDDAGSIEVGRRADLAVLDRNVFDRALGPIGEAGVEMTLAAGRVVHGA